jgi:hypothetical protein
LLPFNGRREGARLIAIPGEVGIELDNQPCVRRGSDRFEQFLQPQRLNSWTTHWVASKILKSPLISNSVSNNISHCSIVGWEDWARELDAWEVDGVVLSIVEFGQDFCRTCGEQSWNSLVKNNLQTNPTPCKRRKSPTTEATTLCMSDPKWPLFTNSSDLWPLFGGR